MFQYSFDKNVQNKLSEFHDVEEKFAEVNMNRVRRTASKIILPVVDKFRCWRIMLVLLVCFERATFLPQFFFYCCLITIGNSFVFDHVKWPDPINL